MSAIAQALFGIALACGLSAIATAVGRVATSINALAGAIRELKPEPIRSEPPLRALDRIAAVAEKLAPVLINRDIRDMTKGTR